MPEPFVELRAHTACSFGDSAMAPERLAAKAAKLGYAALGVTDTADLGGLIKFARAARVAGLKPIAGVELVVEGHPAAFLARSAEGYRHLSALVTRSRTGQLPRWRKEDAGREAYAPPRGRPRVTWAELAEQSGDLHALTGPASGELATLLRAGRRDEAREALARWRELFGERLAVEVQYHQVSRTEEALAGALIELAEAARVPWVVTNDPRYFDRNGRLTHDILTALRAEVTLEEAAVGGLLLPNGGWELLSPAVMAARWAGRPAGIEESARIAAACRFDITWARPPMPDFPMLTGGESAQALLRRLVEEGAAQRWGTIGPKQRRQIDHELALIDALDFAGFFLVMWDAVREARARGILCQGRGSAANSTVAYCLGITAVDPVEHGLLFERFLSPARKEGETEAPDIDLDLEHERREEILDYAYQKWGRNRAALTAVTQIYYGPNAVQDAMRAFGYPHALAVTLSKRVHRCDPKRAAAAIAGGLAAAHGVDVTSARGRKLLRAIAGFQDLPRLRSTHPGGFVLTAASLGDYLPVEPTTMGRTIVQFDKDDLDDIVVPKFDFLGLGALSQVRNTLELVKRHHHRAYEIYAIDQNDAATYRMISAGDTIGMFQIESRAQIASLVHTRPERLYDIVVQVALVRPGPIQARFVHPYTQRRRGNEPVTYLHPGLEPILERTQGIPIFQEQAMTIAMTLGGYTATQADELRRTMGQEKKQPRLHAALQRLREAMIARKIAEPIATRITEDLKSFGNYGFPESHAWSFGLIAYATAWLKAHYPAAFYAGILNAWPMGFYSPATLVHDARRHDVEVRPPCLARGDWDCTLEATAHADRPAMRVGWRHIRGLGDQGRKSLQAARSAGPFTGIADVVRRAGLIARDVAALARAGAFAAWTSDRRRAAWEALRVAGDNRPLAPAHPAEADPGFAPRPVPREREIIADYHAVGLSVLGHPMERLRAWCDRQQVLGSRAFRHRRHREQVVVAGLAVVRQRPGTAKGTVFILLEDEHGVINVVVFPRIAEAHREIVMHGSLMMISGRVERDDPEINLIAERFEALDDQGLVHHSHDWG